MYILIIIIYILGYFFSLFILHRFKKELGVDCYDNDCYDNGPYDWGDYESNAEAYATWSLFWPLYWAIRIIVRVGVLIWKFLIWTSRKMEK